MPTSSNIERPVHKLALLWFWLHKPEKKAAAYVHYYGTAHNFVEKPLQGLSPGAQVEPLRENMIWVTPPSDNDITLSLYGTDIIKSHRSHRALYWISYVC